MTIMTQNRLIVCIGLATAAIVVACDAAPTGPSEITSVQPIKTAIEGDTTLCRSGWVVVSGRYVCNEE